MRNCGPAWSGVVVPTRLPTPCGNQLFLFFGRGVGAGWCQNASMVGDTLDVMIAFVVTDHVELENLSIIFCWVYG